METKELKDITLEEIKSALWAMDGKHIEYINYKKEVALYTIEQEEENYNELAEWLEVPDGKFARVVPGLGFVKFVESYGGEGKGSAYWLVFKVYDANAQEGTTTERFFKLDGYYSSYDGGYFDDFEEVAPVTRSVVFYE